MLHPNTDIEALHPYIGWTIKDVTMTYERYYPDGTTGFTEGGLTLKLKKGTRIETIVLGYTELGLWRYEQDAFFKSKKRTK